MKHRCGTCGIKGHLTPSCPVALQIRIGDDRRLAERVIEDRQERARHKGARAFLRAVENQARAKARGAEDVLRAMRERETIAAHFGFTARPEIGWIDAFERLFQ